MRPAGKIVVCALLLALCAVAHSIFSLRILLSHGAFQVMRMITGHRFFVEAFTWHPADALLQAPAVAALLFLRFDGLSLFTQRLLGACYELHPFVSLFFTYRFLKARGRSWFVLFPICSFGAATLFTLGFPTGGMPLAFSFFWPLCFYTTLKRPDSVADLAILFVLACGLAMSEPLSLTLFVPLIAFVVARGFKQGKATRLEYLGLAVLVVAADLLIYFQLQPLKARDFFGSLTFVPSWLGGIAGCVAALFCASRYFNKSSHATITAGLAILASLVAATLHGELSPEHAYTARGFSLLVCATLASVYLIEEFFELKLDHYKSAIFASACVLIGTVYHFGSDLRWSESLARIRNQMSATDGCVLIPSAEFERNYPGIPPWTFHDLSVLAQGKDRIRSIAYVAPFRPLEHRDPGERDIEPCGSTRVGFFPEFYGMYDSYIASLQTVRLNDLMR